MTDQEIVDLINLYERESKALKKEAIKMCWYMRGGITLDQVMQLSLDERTAVSELIKDNLEVTKETKLPFF